MTRQSIVKAAAAAAVAGAVGFAAAPAFGAGSTSPTAATTPASSSDRLATIQANAKTAIDNRVTALNAVIGVLNASPFMGTDAQTLVQRAQNDIAGLNALESTIQADTTAPQARDDAKKIVTDYRVYALALPVDHLVRASDSMANVAIPDLQKLEQKWSSSTDPQVQQLLADMKTQTTNAAASLNGVAGRLEGYTPSGWSAGVLSTDRQDVVSARKDLKQARDDAKQIHQLLKASRPTTTTTAQ